MGPGTQIRIGVEDDPRNCKMAGEVRLRMPSSSIKRQRLLKKRRQKPAFGQRMSASIDLEDELCSELQDALVTVAGDIARD